MVLSNISSLSSKEVPASIMVCSDLHYLSPRLSDGGEGFLEILGQGDGKVTQYIEEITNALIDEIKVKRPDVLILNGDLTFNGAYESHIDLISKLRIIQEELGTQVLVIPGEHDFNNKNAASFFGATYNKKESITPEAFKMMYYEFGFKQAVSTATIHKDRYSFSYVYPLRKDLWIAMLDINSFQKNYIYDKTYKWLKARLNCAKRGKAKVITVSHQSMLPHLSLFKEGSLLKNPNQLLSLYKQQRILCNLAGHQHSQHMQSDGFTEILTSSIAISPHQYGMARYDGFSVYYNTQPLNIDTWAKKQGIDNVELLNFNSYSRKFLEMVYRNHISAYLYENGLSKNLSKSEKSLIINTFASLTADFFSGKKIDIVPFEKGIKLWRKLPISFFSSYLENIIDNADNENLYFTMQRVRKRATCFPKN